MSQVLESVQVMKINTELAENLMRRCGLLTLKELQNNALALLEWVVQQKEAGCRIVALNPDGSIKAELCMPALSVFRE